jgi:hypothetical protein
VTIPKRELKWCIPDQRINRAAREKITNEVKRPLASAGLLMEGLIFATAPSIGGTETTYAGDPELGRRHSMPQIALRAAGCHPAGR